MPEFCSLGSCVCIVQKWSVWLLLVSRLGLTFCYLPWLTSSPPAPNTPTHFSGCSPDSEWASLCSLLHPPRLPRHPLLSRPEDPFSRSFSEAPSSSTTFRSVGPKQVGGQIRWWGWGKFSSDGFYFLSRWKSRGECIGGLRGGKRREKCGSSPHKHTHNTHMRFALSQEIFRNLMFKGVWEPRLRIPA